MNTENCTITEGATLTGAKFELIANFDPKTSAITSLRLEWLANGEVGPIGVPLKLHAPYGQLFYELTHGCLTEETRRASFAS